MYHYGMTIREYREQAKMTQQQLADRWPKSERFGGGEGVAPTYIQDIEHGRKRIDDPQTLRKVCDMLHIPYWKVGISEYDPFTQTVLPGHGKSMYDETLDTIEELVRQIWSLRCAARIAEADKGIKQLGKLFAYFNDSLPPPVRLERRYVFLYVQYLRLKATADLEKTFQVIEDQVALFGYSCIGSNFFDDMHLWLIRAHRHSVPASFSILQCPPMVRPLQGPQRPQRS